MNEELLISIGVEAIKVTIYLAGPLLLAAMLVGIVVSVLQTVTQINESTLTFIPKIIAVVLVLFVMSPWMLETFKNYTTQIILSAGERGK